ncbi:MAG: PIN domain-containing protein [Oscillospiraceae bacterium]|jgi:predicted nucleic acid-binding protein|nr:PIN domain-containing protein [Oscillospiraceae bacterium]
MTYALDTNIISYILRNDDGVKRHWRLEEANGNRSTIPLIVYYEIKRGLLSVGATEKLRAFDRVFSTLGVEVMSVLDMDVAARIYAERKRQGRPIEDSDLLIAAQAVSRGYTLVTNNIKHFEGISGLQLTNWKA